MKKSRLTILAVFCLICAMALSLFATSVKATTMEFGLQEYRKAREDGAQYAYKVSDKYVWKIVTYNGQSIDYDKAIYCLKAEQGFYTSSPGVFRQEYDTSYDFKNKSSMPTLPVAEEDYNSIVWLLNHAYIQSAETATQDKATLLANAGLTGNIELTDDDLDVIQQLAIWYFTNKEDPVYHTDFAGEPSLQVVLEAKKASDGGTEDYKAVEDKNRDRWDQMEKLFKYLVTNAKSATESSNVNEAPLSLDRTTPAVTAEGDNYIIGPYKINKNNDTPYTLNVTVTDRNGNDLTGKYTLLDSNKTDITDKTITDLVGQTFYLKISADTVVADSIDGIKFSMNGTYTTTTATYWTNSTNNTVQPIVVIERTPQEFTDNNEVFFTVSGKYSFKLVKVDSNDITKKLQGVEFEITTPTGTQNYTTDENGEINIADIEITNPGVDTITIKEIKAPEPYKMLLEEPLVLNVTKDLSNGSYTATDAELVGYDENAVQIQDGVVTITVANEPKIFDLALKGNTYHYIAQYLTKRKIKTPASYYNYVWNTKCINTNCISQEYGVWVDTTIKAILTNRIYTGDAVQGKTKKINYKLKKTVKNNPNDYLIVENTHEAIIDRNTFNYVQTLLPKNVKRPEKKRFYLLDGLLYCGDCKHRITIRYQNKTGRSYTTCDYYRTYSKYHVCTTHTNNYEVLEKVILDNIREVCKKYLDKNKIKEDISNIKFEDNTLKIKKQIESLEITNNKLTESLDKTYMDRLKGIIDEEQYLRVSENIKTEIDNNKNNIYNLKNENIESNKIDNKQIEKYINEFLSLDSPTRELIINLIEKFYIYQDKTIDIIFTFKNVT